MSAFLVSEPTMHAVVTSIIDLSERFSNIPTHRDWHPGDPMPATLFWSERQIEAGTRIGRALYRMNNKALGVRYGDEADPLARTYVFVPQPRMDAVQRFKCIECLLYQCMEGDVPEQPMYRALQRLGLEAARSIVVSSPEYGAAKWGIL